MSLGLGDGKTSNTMSSTSSYGLLEQFESGLKLPSERLVTVAGSLGFLLDRDTTLNIDHLKD